MSPAENATEGQPTSELVVEAIADQADVDPLDFDVPLGDVVDPDALDSLFDSQFGHERKPGRVEFTYQDFLVTVLSEPAGVAVEVSPVEESAGADTSIGRQGA